MEQCPIASAQKKVKWRRALALEKSCFYADFLVWIEPDSMEISQ